MPVRSDLSARRAVRLDERTAEKVATAKTRVPPAVASDEIVCQSDIDPGYSGGLRFGFVDGATHRTARHEGGEREQRPSSADPQLPGRSIVVRTLQTLGSPQLDAARRGTPASVARVRSL